MPAPPRTPYTGPYRKLVLAFDIGTTYSGVSYSILDPGEVPEIHGVARFPGHITGDSKIPTVIYYDQNGEVRAIGAETQSKTIEEKAEEEGWVKAAWFKLHMSPKTLRTSEHTKKIPPLPENKTVIDLFADFMRYLYECAKTYIQETHASGAAVFSSFSDRIEYVLAHPNGWKGVQQDQMRRAAILAGLIPDTEEGRARVQCVTEGEASLHYCIQNGFATQSVKEGDGLLIVDAGGGTIDLSAYAQTSGTEDLSFEEIADAVPECELHGAVFVTQRARDFVENLLRGTVFFDDVNRIAEVFEKTVKLTFRDPAEPQYIQFGGFRDTDAKLNIQRGKLKLLGKDVATFYAPAISYIVQAVKDQKSAAQKKITTILLVGGFAANEYLFAQLKASLESLGFTLFRPDRHLNKAVADGAVSFHLDHFVNIRVSKFAYGVACSVPFNPFDAEHRRRSILVYTSLSGMPMIPGAFDVVLRKGVQVSEATEFRRPYSRVTSDLNDLKSISTPIRYYRGPLERPEWMDVDNELYSTLCHVNADTTQMTQLLRPVTSFVGSQYYRLQYDIILSFGLTEFKAQICWQENGEEKRGPAKIVYEDDPDPDPNPDFLDILQRLLLRSRISPPGASVSDLPPAY